MTFNFLFFLPIPNDNNLVQNLILGQCIAKCHRQGTRGVTESSREGEIGDKKLYRGDNSWTDSECESVFVWGLRGQSSWSGCEGWQGDIRDEVVILGNDSRSHRPSLHVVLRSLDFILGAMGNHWWTDLMIHWWTDLTWSNDNVIHRGKNKSGEDIWGEE